MSGFRPRAVPVIEYNTEFCLPQKTSCRPFSLGELIRFLDSVKHLEADASWKCFGFVLSYNECNLECGADLETLQDLTSVSSDFYPELGSHYCQVIEEWYLGREREQGWADRNLYAYLQALRVWSRRILEASEKPKSQPPNSQ
jgi:hypothetical protein